jgi:hypothetical protein
MNVFEDIHLVASSSQADEQQESEG